MPGVGRGKHDNTGTVGPGLTAEARMPRQRIQIRVTEISNPSSFHAQLGSGENALEQLYDIMVSTIFGGSFSQVVFIRYYCFRC